MPSPRALQPANLVGCANSPRLVGVPVWEIDGRPRVQWIRFHASYPWARGGRWIKFFAPLSEAAMKLDEIKLRLLFAFHRNLGLVRFTEES